MCTLSAALAHTLAAAVQVSNYPMFDLADPEWSGYQEEGHNADQRHIDLYVAARFRTLLEVIDK